MQRFESMRRVMGGFMPRPEPAAAPAKSNDEAILAALRRVEILGRATLRVLSKLEKTMAEQNVTVADILAAAQAQRDQVTSMSTMLQGIHARIMQLVAGQVSPQTQADMNAAFAEITGNSRALSDAITTYTPDAQAPTPPVGDGSGAQSGPRSTLVATSLGISSSKNPANQGDTVSLSAGVTKEGATAETPTGIVSFSWNGGSQTGSVDSTGVAVISTNSLPVGDVSISASYSGDANFSGSSASFVQSVMAGLPANTDQGGAASGGAPVNASGSTGAADPNAPTGQAPQS